MAGDSDADRLTYSVPELSRRLGISVRTLYTIQAKGDGPPVVKLGGRTVIRREAAEAWLASREQPAVTRRPAPPQG
jgi:predicted DNA-binding transcriptional regulator AlpA